MIKIDPLHIISINNEPHVVVGVEERMGRNPRYKTERLFDFMMHSTTITYGDEDLRIIELVHRLCDEYLVNESKPVGIITNVKASEILQKILQSQ